jgi:hypothetical protein
MICKVGGMICKVCGRPGLRGSDLYFMRCSRGDPRRSPILEPICWTCVTWVKLGQIWEKRA